MRRGDRSAGRFGPDELLTLAAVGLGAVALVVACLPNVSSPELVVVALAAVPLVARAVERWIRGGRERGGPSCSS